MTHLQAITTKYLGPTNHRAGRIKATAARGLSITIEYQHGLGTNANHARAAGALCQKLGWYGTYASGGMELGNAYVAIGDIYAGPLLDKENEDFDGLVSHRDGVDYIGSARA